MSLELRTITLDDGNIRAVWLEPEYSSNLEEIIQRTGISEEKLYSNLYRSKENRLFSNMLRMWVIDYYHRKSHVKPQNQPIISMVE